MSAAANLPTPPLRDRPSRFRCSRNMNRMHCREILFAQGSGSPERRAQLSPPPQRSTRRHPASQNGTVRNGRRSPPLHRKRPPGLIALSRKPTGPGCEGTAALMVCMAMAFQSITAFVRGVSAELKHTQATKPVSIRSIFICRLHFNERRGSNKFAS